MPVLLFLRRQAKLIVGAAVSIIALWFVFRQVNLRELYEAVKAIDPWWLLASLALFYTSMYIRAVRWALLFRPKFRIPSRRLFPPMMIGFAFNSILPARVGEFVRAFVVGKRENTGMPTALTTVFSERIFDSVTLLSLLVVSLLILPPIDPAMTVAMGKFTITGADLANGMTKLQIICGILVGGVLFMMIPGIEKRLVGVVEWVPAIPDGISAKVINIIRGVVGGFEAIRDWRNLIAVIFWSLSVWLLAGASNWALAKGMPGVSGIGFLQSCALLTLIGLAILIPASPGYWGLFEAGCVFGVKALGVTDNISQATAYALVMHLVQYVPIVVIGLAFAAKDQVKVTKIDAHAEEAHAEEANAAGAGTEAETPR